MTTNTRTLRATELQERLGGPHAPRLLDVRTPAEFEASHIPGAYNVPLDTLREHREELATHLDEDVVLICRAGPRARQAEEALAGAGLPNLRVLSGGMQAWEQGGGEVRRGRERWDLERQVRLVAGGLVLTSVVASMSAPALKWAAAGVGGGLTFAALSNTCAMGNLLSKLPYNQTAGQDPRQAIDELIQGK